MNITNINRKVTIKLTLLFLAILVYISVYMFFLLETEVFNSVENEICIVLVTYVVLSVVAIFTIKVMYLKKRDYIISLFDVYYDLL